jgi:SNF2 family DNA or RNA helicase
VETRGDRWCPSVRQVSPPQVASNKSRFIHRITRARCYQRPEEDGGGLLSDEMGMGKSLSTLSLIVKTVQEGHAWARKQQAEDAADGTTEAYSHGTLIIVPSACR